MRVIRAPAVALPSRAPVEHRLSKEYISQMIYIFAIFGIVPKRGIEGKLSIILERDDHRFSSHHLYFKTLGIEMIFPSFAPPSSGFPGVSGATLALLLALSLSL